MKTIWGETIWWAVYGIFKKEQCLYVGATKNSFYRELDHKRRFGKRCEFKVFHYTRTKSRAAQLESKLIRKYRTLGQAKFNRNGGLPSKRVPRRWAIYANKFGDLSVAPCRGYKEIIVREMLSK